MLPTVGTVFCQKHKEYDPPARAEKATNGRQIARPHPHMFRMTQYMTQWKSTREPPRTKAELREMLAEAVRDTQAENKRLQKAMRDPGKKAT